jgi:hypothetical protein
MYKLNKNGKKKSSLIVFMRFETYAFHVLPCFLFSLVFILFIYFNYASILKRTQYSFFNFNFNINYSPSLTSSFSVKQQLACDKGKVVQKHINIICMFDILYMAHVFLCGPFCFPLSLFLLY